MQYYTDIIKPDQEIKAYAGSERDSISCINGVAGKSHSREHAINSAVICLTAHTLKDEFNNRTDFALEAFGDEFYDLVCPLGTGIKNSFAGEYIELLMQKLGKPTGVIEKVRAEFFNNYQWFMYWERDGYVICIKIDERESGGSWSSEFSEPKLITDSAWDFVKEETLTNDEDYEFNDIRF